MWKFLDCLEVEQVVTDVKMTKILLQESPPPRQAKWICSDQQQKNIVDKYDEYTDILFFSSKQK